MFNRIHLYYKVKYSLSFSNSLALLNPLQYCVAVLVHFLSTSTHKKQQHTIYHPRWGGSELQTDRGEPLRRNWCLQHTGCWSVCRTVRAVSPGRQTLGYQEEEWEEHGSHKQLINKSSKQKQLKSCHNKNPLVNRMLQEAGSGRQTKKRNAVDHVTCVML